MFKEYDFVIGAGCSYVDGYEIRYEDGSLASEEFRVAKILSEKLCCDTENIAKRGASNERIIRSIYNWVESNETYKNPLLVIGLTGTARYSAWNHISENWIDLHPEHINYVENKSDIIFQLTSGMGKPKDLKFWLTYYYKWIYSDEKESQTLQRNIIFLHHYLKYNNCDYVLFNSLQDSLEDIKSRINYLSFNEDYTPSKKDKIHSGDCWNEYLRWQMENVDGEEYKEQEKYRSFIPPYGKRFCGGHPSPNAHKELAERIYRRLNND